MSIQVGTIKLTGHLHLALDGVEGMIDLGVVEIPLDVALGFTTPPVVRRQPMGKPAYGHPDAPPFPSADEQPVTHWPFNVQHQQGPGEQRAWGIYDERYPDLFAPISSSRVDATRAERSLHNDHGSNPDTAHASLGWERGWSMIPEEEPQPEAKPVPNRYQAQERTNGEVEAWGVHDFATDQFTVCAQQGHAEGTAEALQLGNIDRGVVNWRAAGEWLQLE